MVEQWTENPCVAGSIPALSTRLPLKLIYKNSVCKDNLKKNSDTDLFLSCPVKHIFYNLKNFVKFIKNENGY